MAHLNICVFVIGLLKCLSFLRLAYLNVFLIGSTIFLTFFDWLVGLVEMFVAVIGIFKCTCFVIGLLLKCLSFLLLAYLNVCFCVFFFNNNGQSSFYSNVMNKSEYFNLFDFNYNSLSDSKIKQLVDLMKNKYISY